MIILPSHISRVLQPLDISCFKFAFKKERDGATVRNNYNEPNKVMLIRWVNKMFNQTFKNKLDLGLRLHGFGH
jgi:hypothetical protein